MGVTFSVITDEIAPELAQGLAFAREQGLSRIDIRSIGGVNFMSLDASGQKAVAGQVRDAGLTVGCLATPLLKWPAPGQSAGNAGDQFGFDAKGRSTDDIDRAAFEAAEILGTRHLRIFSYLTYPGFRMGDLEAPITALLRLAETHDCVLHVENEPVCNVRTVADLIALMQAVRHPRLKALLDIGNARSAGSLPTLAEVETIMPFTDQVHFKDYSAARRATVPMGEGDIPYDRLLAPVRTASRQREIVWTIETHVPTEPEAATRRSLAGLRKLAGA